MPSGATNDKPASSGVTLRDIARKLAVSHVTVSLALRNSAQISVARRREIQELAAQMGYRPNPMAAALGQLRFTSKAQAVSAELAWINYRENSQSIRRFKEFDLYWQGANETAKWFGYNLEEFVCDSNFTLNRLEKVLLARGVHGILIPPHSKLPHNWDSFQWGHFSAVRFGHSIVRPRVHVVTSDQTSNSLLAFSKIQAHGYQRIGFVTSRISSTRYKAGVLMAQSALDVKKQVPPLVLDTGEDNHADQKALGTWLKKHTPDAILTDIAAMREMLKIAGHRIPEDIGLAVFSVLDGNADAGIYQNPEEIGKAAVEMLISMINHNHVGIPKICRELLIEGEWMDGATLPPRSSVVGRRSTEES
jgi:LacI family transcriptional regulator